MSFFAGVDEGDFVAVLLEHIAMPPEDGAGSMPPIPAGPYAYHEVEANALDLLGPRPTAASRLRLVDGALAWLETATLDEIKVTAIASR